jgi:hypothetical protein
MDDARVASEHPAVDMHDVARQRRARRQAFDEIAVSAVDETNIWLSALSATSRPAGGRGADLFFLSPRETATI